MYHLETDYASELYRVYFNDKLRFEVKLRDGLLQYVQTWDNPCHVPYEIWTNISMVLADTIYREIEKSWRQICWEYGLDYVKSKYPHAFSDATTA